jgi:multidrug efflux pump subunit AcrA (membrane-fusion protein)
LKVALDDARTKFTRARELAHRQLIPQSELDTAEVTVRSTEAQIRSSEAQVTQAEASLNQNQVNLAHTVITAPIDGLVISRNVDVGQTVAASMSAPTLFVLAADLTKMQVVANLDESDVGRIRPAQRVTFRVDAYPAEDFFGTVAQVRLQPIVQQNVVTYATVIDVPNPQLKLKPGMTANVNVEIARRSNVVRVPNAALRFRPTPEIFAALGQGSGGPGSQGSRGSLGSQGWQGSQGGRSQAGSGDETSSSARGASRGEGAPLSRRAPETTRESATPPAAPREPGVPGEPGVPREPREPVPGRNIDPRMAERLQSMSPEQREQFMARMRERGANSGDTGGAGRGRGGAAAAPPPPSQTRAGATTVDALFGPLPEVETRGQVWRYVDKQLTPTRLRLGITDGQSTELLEGDLEAGAELVTNITTGSEAVRTQPGFGFPPFMGPGGRGGDGRGFGNRGGGNRGAGGR